MVTVLILQLIDMSVGSVEVTMHLKLRWVSNTSFQKMTPVVTNWALVSRIIIDNVLV